MELFSDARERATLLDLLRRSSVMRASAPPAVGNSWLVVCHGDPRLPQTSEEELERARRERRPILHLRVEASEAGWLVVRTQREQEPHLVWDSESDAPLTLETIYNLENGGKITELVPARYRHGCRVDYDEAME